MGDREGPFLIINCELLMESADAINRVPTFEMKPLKNGIGLTVKRVGSPTPFDKKKK